MDVMHNSSWLCFLELDMEFTHEPMDSDSIELRWSNNYSDCSFMFEIHVNDRVLKENLRQSSYIIHGLIPATTYKVCLVVHDMHIAKWMHCENATTAGIVGPHNITTIGQGECVYYQLIMFAVDSY